uniref:AVL9 cell migration associated n=1 Tax=Laticauda laticaudata TaxID=8630 RepID=A0A8C5S6F4_LATLA
MIEHGLTDCSQYRPRKSTSEEVGKEVSPPSSYFVSLSALALSNANFDTVGEGNQERDTQRADVPLFQVEHQSSELHVCQDHGQYWKPSLPTSPESSESDWETLDPNLLEDPNLKGGECEITSAAGQTEFLLKESVISKSVPIIVQPQPNTGHTVLVPGLISGLEEDQYGATNILFRQQKHLSDAIVEIEEALVQVHDPDLRKVLNPTTADLRFADFLVKHVTENRDDVFLDGTGWEGGDEWIRAQFGLYLHALLAATVQPADSEKILSDFGTAFVAAWKNTHNYRVWNSNKHPALAEINPSHPFQGQYSVSDVKLRLSHSVQNSERGKKIGNAMVTTSRNVVQTGRAVGQSVGGALTSAKSVMSSWLSTFTQSSQSSGE